MVFGRKKTKRVPVDNTLDIPPPPPIGGNLLPDQLDSAPPNMPPASSSYDPGIPPRNPPPQQDMGMPPPPIGAPDITSHHKAMPPPDIPPMAQSEPSYFSATQDTHDDTSVFGDSAPEEPAQEKPPLRKTLGESPQDKVFVEVDQYRRVLKDLNAIKKSLKLTSNEVTNLLDDIGNEEKIFSDLHENLGQIEKQLAELETALYNH